MGLGKILEKYRGDALAMGERLVKRALIEELERYDRKSRFVLWVMAGLFVALFLLALVLAYLDLRAGSSRLVPIVSASGVSAAGLLALIWKAGRDWTRSHLVLGLARVSSEADVKKLVAKIIESGLS